MHPLAYKVPDMVMMAVDDLKILIFLWHASKDRLPRPHAKTPWTGKWFMYDVWAPEDVEHIFFQYAPTFFLVELR